MSLVTDQPALKPVDAPSRLLQWAESQALFELGAFMAASPLLRAVGRGDRHPVLVLPGFTGADNSTAPLRWILRSQGYWTHGWGLGQNMGPTGRIIRGMHQRLEMLADRHGRKVSMVGWSLGGIYARELARDHPDLVRQVITLGSPFRLEEGDKSAATGIAEQVAHRWRAEELRLTTSELAKPPVPVPSTAIYSRSDGVVRWHVCINEACENHENIEVRGTHTGLGWNPFAVYAISDRLAQPEGSWRPFRPPFGLRHAFPKPADYDHDRRLAPLAG